MSRGKRYIQVESQLYHITGIFRTIIHSSNNLYFCKFNDVESAYFESQEDGTITFYKAEIPDVDNSGIWTYVVYECPEGEEKEFRDLSIDTSINYVKKLLAGERLIQITVDINEYLQSQYNQDEYLDVRLPLDWNTSEAKEIAELLLEELRGFKTSSIFAEGAGKKYKEVVLNWFVQAAQQVWEIGGTLKDFELAQYNVLKKIEIHDMANLILEYNDYRIWQTALPTKSKAVEYAFTTALNLICHME